MAHSLKTTEYKLPENIPALVREQMRFDIVAAAKSAFAEIQENTELSPEQKQTQANNLYMALTGLHSYYPNDKAMEAQTVKEIMGDDFTVTNIEGEAVAFDEAILAKRQAFVEKYFPDMEEKANSLIVKLAEEGHTIPDVQVPLIEEMVKLSVVSISHYGVLESISAEYQNFTKANDPSLGVDVEAVSSTYKNPYGVPDIEGLTKQFGGNKERAIKRYLMQAIQHDAMEVMLLAARSQGVTVQKESTQSQLFESICDKFLDTMLEGDIDGSLRDKAKEKFKAFYKSCLLDNPDLPSQPAILLNKEVLPNGVPAPSMAVASGSQTRMPKRR